jgi:thiamine-phosphate pyrophosphorylase
MLVTDRHVAGGDGMLVRKVKEAVTGGVNVVQVREKDLTHDDAVSLARRLQEAIAGRALMMLNGSPQATLDARADGIHLPEDAEAPHEWPRSLLIGRSVHSSEAARRAVVEGADYVVFGPVYETESHSTAPPAGLVALRGVAESVSVPVIAIGGVTAGRVPKVLAAGASGVAVIRAILAAGDPKAAAQLLRAALEGERVHG